VPRFVGVRLGRVLTSDDEAIEVDVTLEAAPSVLFDGMAVPDGVEALSAVGQALEFVKDQYRHYKPILAIGAGSELLTHAGVPLTLPSGKADPGLLVVADGREGLSKFAAAIAKHRHFERHADPPVV
jgi:catalase